MKRLQSRQSTLHATEHSPLVIQLPGINYVGARQPNRRRTGPRGREKDGLQQTLQSDVDPSDTDQHSAAPALIQRSDRACGLRDLKLVPCWLVHPSRSPTNSEQVSPLVISR